MLQHPQVETRNLNSAGSPHAAIVVNGSNFTSETGAYLVFSDPLGNLYYSYNHQGLVGPITSTQWNYLFDNNGAIGTWTVQVFNPDGQSSNAFTFEAEDSSVVEPAPKINDVSPASLLASNDVQLLKVTGTNFQGGSFQPRSYLLFLDPSGTSYKSTDHPEREISVTSTEFDYDIETSTTGTGTWSVQVVNPDYQVSNAASFQVATPTSTPIGSGAVVTTAATAVGSSSATLNGSVNPGGSAGRVYFEYSKDSSLATSVIPTYNFNGG